MLPVGALRISIEEKYGALPYFLFYALLEWLLIALLFLDGFLAFLSYEIARLFELETPCLLCTRLDHVLVQRSSNFYYNESMCEGHKRDISTLTYCHVHGRLSDIRSMCRRCLLASDKGSGCDKHKSLVGDERNVELKQLKKYEVEILANERIGIMRCSCCGEHLRSKSPSRYKAGLSVAVPASPRAAWFSSGGDDCGNGDLQSSRYTELKLIAAGLHGDHEDAPLVDSHGREDMNHMIEDEPRTPHFADRNRFFGISLTDGAVPASPKRLELVMDEEGNEGDIVARLKRQVTLDRRSLMALYVELDAERSASAVAANNAMAMITRLQEEKAAVQMEALQYQRMMDEQAEYDQEAMQMMKDMLLKRESEIKALECELEKYRMRYVDSDLCEVDLNEDFQDVPNSGVVSSSNTQNKDENGIQDIPNSGVVSSPATQNEDESGIQDVPNSGVVSSSTIQNEDKSGIQDVPNSGVVSSSASQNEDEREIQAELAALDYEGEMCHLLGVLGELEEKMFTASDEASASRAGEEERLAKQVTLVKERLRAVEAESIFLKNVAKSLHKKGEGVKVLREISQHLRKQRKKLDVF